MKVYSSVVERAAEGDKFLLRKVRLDSGGYAPDGTYFGIGDPLYELINNETGDLDYIRASDRQRAAERFGVENRLVAPLPKKR